LNLPSFSGGLNPWGTPNPKKQRDVGFYKHSLALLIILLKRGSLFLSIVSTEKPNCTIR